MEAASLEALQKRHKQNQDDSTHRALAAIDRDQLKVCAQTVGHTHRSLTS